MLAPLLAAAIEEAARADPRLREVVAGGNEPLLVVPVPSAAAAVRRRGDAPLRLLVDAALRGSTVPADAVWVAPALALRRRVADQAGSTGLSGRPTCSTPCR